MILTRNQQPLKGSIEAQEDPTYIYFDYVHWRNAWEVISELDFDQLILEFYSPPNGGWIHCSYNFENNRKKCLTASRDENGNVQYTEGLSA